MLVLKDKQPVILVTGASGQLGQAMQVAAARFPDWQFISTHRQTLSVESGTALNDFLEQNPVTHCINCAAYTAVDKAETDAATAFAINATAVQTLATACRNNSVQLVHISTDYVFDGTAAHPYKETDAANPAGVYGVSKRRGEELALEAHPGTVIIRTSWLCSVFGHNFVKTMLRLMAERENINVVNDQLGRPTFAADLATAILAMIQSPEMPGGIYHFSGSGEVISWYDFAMAIKAYTGSNCQINPIPTSGYPTPARRPAYSVLDTAKISNLFSLLIPHWKESLHRDLALLTGK